MVQKVQLPDGSYVGYPDDMDRATIAQLATDYARSQGMTDPGFGATVGAGIDTLQSQLSSLPIGLINATTEDNGETIDPNSSLGEWKKLFEDIRTKNKNEAGVVQQRLTEVQDITTSPGTVVKQQIAFQLPQLLGLTAASMNPAGKVLGPATMQMYFTASNLDRQIDEGQSTNLLKAAGYGSGQTASETLLLHTLGAIPGAGFVTGFAKALATGVSTEVAQQMMERASADLPLGDEKAVKEYVDNAIGAGIFVGAGAPMSYMANNRGNVKAVSEKIKAKIDAGQPISPEEILEEQIRDVPGTVLMPDPENPENTINMSYDDLTNKHVDESLDNKNKGIIQSAGFNSDHFSTKIDRLKAASVIIQNISDSELVNSKKQELVNSGVEIAKVEQYKKENPNDFFDKPSEKILSEIQQVPVEKALELLQPVRSKQASIQNAAIDFNSGQDLLGAEPTIHQLATDIDEIHAEQEAIKSQMIRKPLKKLNPQAPINPLATNEALPEAAPIVEPKRPTLTVKSSDKVKQLVENVINQPPVLDSASLNNSAMAEVAKGRNPDLLASVVNNHAGELIKTFNDYAKTQKDMLDFKRVIDSTREPTPTADVAPINPGITKSAAIDDLIQAAASTDIKPETVPFVDKTIRTVVRRLSNNNLGRNPSVKSVSESINTDPIYKIQYANFLRTTLDPASSTPNQVVEQFYHVFDHTNVLSEVDKRQLQRAFPDIFKKVHKSFGLDPISENMDVGPENQKEILANIFSELRDGNKAILNGLPLNVKAMFKKMNDFVNQVQKELKKNKVFDDTQLFGSNDINIQQVRDKRMKFMADEALMALNEKAIQDSADQAAEFQANVEEAAGDHKFHKGVYNWVRNVSSLHTLASRGDSIGRVAGTVLSLLDSMQTERSQIQSKVKEHAQNLKVIEHFGGIGFIEQIKERIHRLEETGGAYDLSEPGVVYLLDKKGARTGRIKNKRAYDAFSEIDQFKNTVLTQEEESLRNRLPEFGIGDKNMAIEDIKSYATILEGNANVTRLTDPKLAKIRDVQVEQLNNIVRDLKIKQELKTKAWFPRTRVGRLGVVVKNNKTGRNEYTAQLDPETGVLKDTPNKHQLNDIFDEIRGLYSDDTHTLYGANGKKYSINNLNPDTFVPISFTRNEEIKRHGRNLQSAFELLDDMGGLTDDTELRNDIKKTFDMRAEGNFQYFGKRDFVNGYMKDPFQTLETFAQRFAGQTTGRKYHGLVNKMQQVIDAKSPYSAHLKAIGERVEYIRDPKETLEHLKSFNYMYAMGGSLKSAFIQQLNGVTNGLGILNSLGGNVVRNLKNHGVLIGKTGLNMFKLSDDGDVTPSFMIGNPVEVKKIIRNTYKDYLTEAQLNDLTNLIHTRYFSSLVEQTNLEGQAAIKKRYGQMSLMRRAMTLDVPFVGDTIKALNKMPAISETTGRLAYFVNATNLMTKEPQALRKMEQIWGQEAKYQIYKQKYLKEGFTPETIAGLYLLDKTFYVTGSTGKSKLATSGPLNLISPFSNFALQQTSGIKNMWARDPKAFAYTMGAYMALGGLAGIPFFDNLKDLVSYLFKALSMGSMDLELEIRNKIFTETGSAPLAEAITKGIPSVVAGTDLSGSISQQVPFVNEALKILNPETKLTDVTSLSGSYLTSLGKGLGDAYSELQDPYKDFDIGNFLNSVTPYKGARDILKAYSYATKPIVSRSDQPILPSQGDDPVFLLLTAAGFQPSEIVRARDRYYFEQLQNQAPEMDKLRKQRNNLWEKYSSTQNPEEKERLREGIRTNLQEARKTARDNHISFSIPSYNNEGRRKGRELVSGTRDPKRLPKRLRKDSVRNKELFMVE